MSGECSACSSLQVTEVTVGVTLCVVSQDVVSQNKKLKTYSSADPASARGPSGLKSLCKANRDRLEAYQHLFYLLQTNPVYLARLIFALPQSRTTKFMESAILTLYNYASNQREEYLLLKLFKTALQHEIKSVAFVALLSLSLSVCNVIFVNDTETEMKNAIFC